MSSKESCLSRISAAAALCLFSTPVFSGGFDLPTITASHQGTANANAAEAKDPSVIYYNPAGLARLKGGVQVSQGLSILAISGSVAVEEARGTPEHDETVGRRLENEAATSGDAGTFWPAVLAGGAAFISLPIDENVTAGFGVFAAGGGNLNNKSDWAGAYQIENVAIELINFNPSVAIRFDEKHSIGAGFSVIAGHIRQKLQIDIAGVGPYLLRSALENDAIVAGSAVAGLCGINVIDTLACRDVIQALGNELATDDSRGSAKVEMYGYGLGFNLGYLFAPTDSLRLGIAYRSESTIKLRGKIEWDFDDIEGTSFYNVISPALTMGKSLPDFLADTLRPDTVTKSDLIVPERTSANVFFKLNEKTDVMADITFIKSSVVKKIKVDFLDVKIGDRTIRQGSGGIDTQWRDSFKVSLGGNYHVDEKVTLKSGFQYDKTPIPSAEFRHPGTPDSDRYTFSWGVNYVVDNKITLDAAYGVTFFADSESNYRDFCRVVTRDNADGTYNPEGESCTGNGGSFKGRFFDTRIQTLSFQLNQKF